MGGNRSGTPEDELPGLEDHRLHQYIIWACREGSTCPGVLLFLLLDKNLAMPAPHVKKSE